jgi:hypothetical protein
MNQLLRSAFFIIFLFPALLSAQDNDSVNLRTNHITSFFTAGQFETDSVSYVNSSLSGFQNYLPHNHLGNAGLAIQPLIFSTIPSAFGFHYAPNHFRDYFYSSSDPLFFNTHSPFTDLRYIFGSKQEQSFKGTFSYNVKKNWNITANFFRIRSEGFYLKQGTNDNFITFSTNYRSKTNRYCLLAAITYNYVQNAENGGIRDDSVFENSGNSDKKLMEINLQSAKMSFLQRNIFIRQYLNFGKKENDSSAIIPGSRLILSSSLEDNLFRYKDEDPLSGFYSGIYHDSSSTNDSAYHFMLDNKLSWKRTDDQRHRGFADWFGIGVSIQHQLMKVKQWEIDSTFSNMIAGAELYNTYSKNKIWYSLSGNYCFSGYNENDILLQGSVKEGLKDSTASISLHFSSFEHAPDFIYHRYSSNHFTWNKELEKTKTSSAGVNFTSGKYRLAAGADISSIENPVYFDNFGIARQYIGTIPVVSAYLKKDFTLYNWHLDNAVNYQDVPDSTVIRLPQLVLQHSFYYEGSIKKIMRIQLGASVYFTSAYYADAYMPATAQFYLQSEKKYGNYPFMDVFLNARVKTVRIFIKVDHLNSGWTKNTYMLTPHYPMNGRAFKLGISWRFYD